MPRDILIDPQRTGSGNPNIQFSGSAGNTIHLEVLSEGSVQFTGVSGSLLRISDFPAAGGSLNSLFLSGTVALTGSFIPGESNGFDLGSSTKKWANIYSTSIIGSLTGSNLTAGQVVVAGTGGLLSGSSNFWWDNSNGQVGIGTSLLDSRLVVNGNTVLSGTLNPASDNTHATGTTLKRWANVVSNAFSGSLTMLSDGTTPYLQAGTNVTITTGSNGAVTIAASLAGGTLSGAGTTNYIPKYTASTTLGNSNIFDNGTNVGIGTASPDTSAPLTIDTALNTHIALRGSGNTQRQAIIASNSGVSSNYNGLALYSNTNASFSQANTSLSSWRAILGNFDITADRFAVSRMAAGGASFSEFLTIVSSGNVGVGTTNPAGFLTVSGTIVTKYNTGLESYIAAGTYSAGTTGFYPVYAAGGSFGSNDTVIKYGAGGNNLVLLHGSTVVLSANSSENVSIGTNSYTGRLFVSGSSTAATPTMVVREGVSNPTGGAGTFDVQNSAGTSILFVTGSGRVGIGTSSPTVGFRLDVRGAGRIEAADPRIDLVGTYRGFMAQVVDAGSAAASYWRLYDLTAAANRVIVDSSGNVGIGTTSPIGTLDVRATNPTIVCSNSATRYGYQVWHDATSEYRAGTGGSFPFVFLTANTERARIDSLGNVGIGTSLIDTRLVVNGNSVFSGSVNPDTDVTKDLGSSTKRWNNIYAANISGSLTGSNVTAGQVVVAGAGGVLSGSNDFYWNNSNKRVGIGTSNPTALLSVFGTSANTNIRIGEVFTNYVGINLNGSTADSDYNILSRAADQNLYINRPSGYSIFFREANGNQAVIASGGNVGIGTASTSSKIFVYTTQNDAGTTPSFDFNGAFMRIGDYTTNLSFTNGVGIKIHDAGVIHYSVGQISGKFLISDTSNDGNSLFPASRSDIIAISSTNVGIGTTLIDSKLVVNGNTVISGTLNPDTDATRDLGTSLKRWRTLFAANISGSLTPTGATAGSVFFAGTSGQIQQDNSNFFWDDTNNRLGIGTNSPQALLHVGAGGDTPTVSATAYVTAAGTTNLAIRDSTNNVELLNYAYSGGGLVGTATNHSYGVRTNNATRLTIDTSGNVGIGSTTPGVLLDVAGTTRATSTSTGFLAILSNGTASIREAAGSSANNIVEVHVRPSSGKSGYISFTEDSVADRWSIGIQNGNSSLRFLSGYPTAGTERMTLTSTGNLGIGTASPAKNLHLVGNQPLRMGTATEYWDFIQNTTNQWAFLSNASIYSIFMDNATGNVGIGSNTTSDKLSVNGALSVTGSALPGTDNAYNLGSPTKKWAKVYATSISGSLTGSNVLEGQIVVAGTGGVLSGSNNFWWDNTNARVGIGTITPSSKLHVYNGDVTIDNTYGIAWASLTGPTNGTRTSATLDHYEYGTWTPVFAGQTTAGSYTLANTKAHYVRVGKLVVVTLYTEVSAVPSAGSGNWRITGLPYAATGIGNANIGKYVGMAANIATMSGVVEESQSRVDMYVTTANGTANAQAAIQTYVTTGTKLSMTITYRA